MPLKILIALAMVNKSLVTTCRGSLSDVRGFTSTTCRTAGYKSMYTVCLHRLHVEILTSFKTSRGSHGAYWIAEHMNGRIRSHGGCWNRTVTTGTFVRSFTTRLLMQISTKLEMLTTLSGSCTGRMKSVLTIPMFPFGRLMNCAAIIFLPKCA